jgi:DNA repair exonuclease SbcCD nuclease subunit
MTSINIPESNPTEALKPEIENSKSTCFIHASDIHLGSHQYRNDNRADDFIGALKEILQLAIQHDANFILLGGDVFSSLEMLPGKLTSIVDLLMCFQNNTNSTIPIIAIEGNHDIRKFSRGVKFKQRGQSWLKLLARLGLIVLLDGDLELPPDQIFQPYDFTSRRGGKIQVNNVMIYGTRYLGEKPVEQLSRIRKAIDKDDGLFHVLLQHFGIQGQMEGVPGINLELIQHLKHRVHYLALGHFHKQFILDDWIYNPGASEAVSSIDNSFGRGIFLVNVNHATKFKKTVKIIRLKNRKYQWKTVHFPRQVRHKEELFKHVFRELKEKLSTLNQGLQPSDSEMPVLYLRLRGKEPIKSLKIKEKELREFICQKFPVVDARIYQKFDDSIRTIDKYIK